MKMAKDAMLIMAGALGVLAYQKYGNSVKRKVSKVVDDTMDKVSKKLECME